MNPAEMQILLPVLIAIVFIGLNARRMMRPRRVGSPARSHASKAKIESPCCPRA